MMLHVCLCTSQALIDVHLHILYIDLSSFMKAQRCYPHPRMHQTLHPVSEE